MHEEQRTQTERTAAAKIKVLDQLTIDKIAAGEVIERPASVVKELVENAIDAKASAITVEIKDGGTSFIRITDNGAGIAKEQVQVAFLRHSTSKIERVEDLFSVSSLGFRGEALSSIAAVSQVELITKTQEEITGLRYLIEGGAKATAQEIGAPSGSTFLVRNLFYNTPARKKFLKSNQTEAAYISDLMERLCLSHPEISFKFIVNHKIKLHTSGNANLKEIIYHIYGRQVAANLIPITFENEAMEVNGWIGKPLLARGNRNYETYFINGRYIKSSLLSRGIEEGYKTFMMQHKFPFTVLHFRIDRGKLDINVHPTKMELRFEDQTVIYDTIAQLIQDTLKRSELIYEIALEEQGTAAGQTKPEARRGQSVPEPFEQKRLQQANAGPQKFTETKPQQGAMKEPHAAQPQQGAEAKEPKSAQPQQAEAKEPKSAQRQQAEAKEPKSAQPQQAEAKEPKSAQPQQAAAIEPHSAMPQEETAKEPHAAIPQQPKAVTYEQQQLPVLTVQEQPLFNAASRKAHRIIGQLFDTYWLVQFDDKLYMIDQHAAHEKVLYEKTMSALTQLEMTTQTVYPPILLTLTMQEIALYEKYKDYFFQLGFSIEHFGGKEYAVSGVPANLYGLNGKELLLEILDSLSTFRGNEPPLLITEKIASLSCKGAVKGNQKLSRPEIEQLIDELLRLDNPYHCPHGRPTIISMSKYELEKKFKRII